jgi:hypothetical protein
MKKFIIQLIVLLSGTALHAQNTHLDYNYALKVCNLGSFERTSWSGPSDWPGYHDLHEAQQLELFHPVFAFQWRSKRDNFHELELSDLKWNHAEEVTEMRQDSAGVSLFVKRTRITQSALSLCYEYTFVFFRNRQYSLVPTLGLGINPYYRRDHFFPGPASVFPEIQTHAGIRTLVTPGLSWFFSERFFADLKIPLCLGNADFFMDDKKDDPSIPVNEQQLYTFDMKMFPKSYALRLGIGIRL